MKIKKIYHKICSITLSITTAILIILKPTVSPANKKNFSPPKTEEHRLKILANYLYKIHSKIQSNWNVRNIPLMILHKRYAVVQIWLSPEGKLKKFSLTKSSGFKPYDLSLTKAIKKSSPFPPPPKILANTVSKDGIEILIRRRVFKRKLLPLKTKYSGTAVLPPTPPGQKNKKNKR